MRFEIKSLQKKLNFTIIFVTHDQSEAMAISDRMLVMDMGEIIQVDTPTNLYNKPATKFVYGFLGQSNFVNVTIDDGRVYPEGVTTGTAIPFNISAGSHEKIGVIASRPNEISISLQALTGYPTRIEKRLYLTYCIEYHVYIGSQKIRIHTPHQKVFTEGQSCYIDFKNPRWYPKESGDADLERVLRQVV